MVYGMSINCFLKYGAMPYFAKYAIFAGLHENPSATLLSGNIFLNNWAASELELYE